MECSYRHDVFAKREYIVADKGSLGRGSGGNPFCKKGFPPAAGGTANL